MLVPPTFGVAPPLPVPPPDAPPNEPELLPPLPPLPPPATPTVWSEDDAPAAGGVPPDLPAPPPPTVAVYVPGVNTNDPDANLNLLKSKL